MRQRPRAIRSIVARASIFLLLGAAVNVAVAWALPNARPYIVSEDQVKPTMDDSNLVREFGEAMDDSRLVAIESGMGWRRRLIPLLETETEPEDLGRPALPELTVESAGWPCLALQGMWRSEESRCLWILSSDWLDADLMLGLRPLWPGFAINTLFYAAILWLLFAAPLALRRWRRLKRGLCPACAYPIGTSELCTECGKPVKPHRHFQSSRRSSSSSNCSTSISAPNTGPAPS